MPALIKKSRQSTAFYKSSAGFRGIGSLFGLEGVRAARGHGGGRGGGGTGSRHASHFYFFLQGEKNEWIYDSHRFFLLSCLGKLSRKVFSDEFSRGARVPGIPDGWVVELPTAWKAVELMGLGAGCNRRLHLFRTSSTKRMSCHVTFPLIETKNGSFVVFRAARGIGGPVWPGAGEAMLHRGETGAG